MEIDRKITIGADEKERVMKSLEQDIQVMYTLHAQYITLQLCICIVLIGERTMQLRHCWELSVFARILHTTVLDKVVNHYQAEYIDIHGIVCLD